MKTPLQQVFIFVVFAVASAFGQTVTWTGATDSDFTNSANWAGGISPGSTSDAIFGTSTRTTVNVIGLQMISSLSFSGTSPSYTFTGTTSGRLSLSFGGLTAAANSSTVVFDSTLGLDLMANQTWTLDADTTVRGAISGNAGTLTKAGSKTLRLEGANTYTGNTTIAAGKVIVANGSGSGTGTGTVTIDSGATLQIGDHNTMGAVTGTIVNNGSLILDRTDLLPRISSGILAYYKHEGVISGAGSVTVNRGVVGLTGANTYTGDTTIYGGRVIALNATGSATGTGNVILATDNTVLQFGRGTAYGSISGNIQLSAAGTGVLFSRSDSYQYNGVISGAGVLQNSGTGVLTLGGVNTYAGQTHLLSGTLADAVAGALSPNSRILVSADTTLLVSFNETILSLSSGALLNTPPTGETAGSVMIGSGATLTINSPAGSHESFIGTIGGAGALTKTGAGTQQMGGANTYSGGTTLTSGALFVTTSSTRDPNGALLDGGLGTGLVTLGDGVLLGIGSSNVRLDNAFNVGNNVTLLGSKDDDVYFTLGGAITFTNASTRLHVKSERPVGFWGAISGPAGGALTVDGLGALALFGATDASITAATADAGGISFGSTAALPATLSVNAVNGGYVSVMMSSFVSTAPTPSQLLSRISAPAAFEGTFGVDTEDSMNLIHTFTDNLDFSAFTNSAFRIGSGTAAILAGTITPPVVNGAPLYAFGGVGGHLGLTSALTNVGASPAAVTVSSAAGFDPLMVFFRGANTYTGTLTSGAATANLIVDNGLAVFDSPEALPAGATFAFGSTGPGYVSATEAAGFTSFADFASRVAPSGYNATSILGLDSRAFYDFKIAHGAEAPNPPSATFDGTVDLRSFSSIYLGTATNMVVSGPILAPADGVLRLTTVDGGRLTIASQLGSGINSVVIGMTGPGSDIFADGAVRLTNNNTYPGGTTLLSGALELDNRTSGTSPILPLGTGPLTVAAGGVSKPVLRGPNGGSTSVPMAVILNGALQLNDWSAETSDPLGSSASGITFSNTISGAGSLELYGRLTMQRANTYSGGTILHPGASVGIGANGALGTGAITVEGTAMIFNFASSSDLILANPINLSGLLQHAANGAMQLTGPITVANDAAIRYRWGSGSLTNRISGPISGSGSLTFTAPWSQPIYLLSGTNTYTGGTTAEATMVVFMNESAVPTVGRLTTGFNQQNPSDAGYIGAGFTTNTQSAFLDRFDKNLSTGVIGFDSPDAANPNVFTSTIDLTGFSANTWLGSTSAAILTGVITPSSDFYAFGDGGGTLTVQSALTGTRDVIVESTARPLTLVLQGANTYTGSTSVTNSVLRFGSAGALPASSNITATGAYVGITESVGLTLAAFIQRFSSAANSVIGLDSDNLANPRVVDDAISFAPYSTLASAYLGTSTQLTLNGALTPYATELRLAAVDQGALIVNSPITNGSVRIGLSTLSSEATVTLNGANTYSGGTTLQTSHLLLGHASALGTGSLTVAGDGWLGATTSGLAIPNAIVGSGGLTIEGPNSFELSGGLTLAQLRKTGPGALTISGHNSSLTGNVTLAGGSLILTQDDALGSAGLQLFEATVADFRSAAPFLSGLTGGGLAAGSTNAPGEVRLAANSVLTLTGLTGFGGTITGNAAVVIDNHITNTYGAGFFGANSYTGGTTIKSGAALRVSHDGALGTSGNVTIDGGTLVVQPMTSLNFATTANHALVFNSGRIIGGGTITSDASLIVGSARTLTAGWPLSIGSGLGDMTIPATLKLSFSGSAKLVFDSGGTAEFQMMDASLAGTGWSQIAVAGALDITATAAAPFHLTLASLNFSGPSPATGIAQGFNPGLPYTWTVLTATTITGFDAAKFTIDATGFLNMPVNAGFTLGLNDLNSPTTLLLTYNPAAVPEPSTWALLLAGVAALGVAGLRRRRR